MKSKFLIAASLAAGTLMGIATSAQAVPAVVAGTTGSGSVYVQTAPPPPIYEPMPQARAGHIWTPGHYEWRGDRYAWVGGRWIEIRPGYAWQEARWIQHPDGTWYLVGGSWVRTDNYSYAPGGRGMGDRDHDGIANRYDGDRDGDGVANRWDNFPNNPNRS